MFKSKITPEIIQKYVAKLIDRDYIINITGLSESAVREKLLRDGVEIWDLKNRIKYPPEYYNEICQLYKKKKMTRAEICKKYNIPIEKISLALYWRNIEIWDSQKKKTSKVKSKYYNPKELKNHIFYFYNSSVNK